VRGSLRESGDILMFLVKYQPISDNGLSFFLSRGVFVQEDCLPV